eukprot:TRINITY_DN35033_c0_g1_i1.p1 TRINITY_DN35033_c0_g1~~TRINITY_DN35033_c0_g1_i1.p1  ORF type:complete len:425 (-),score=47.13 TRINITY_DN35033_c0_g1_i1:33-1241(-)
MVAPPALRRRLDAANASAIGTTLPGKVSGKRAVAKRRWIIFRLLATFAGLILLGGTGWWLQQRTRGNASGVGGGMHEVYSPAVTSLMSKAENAIRQKYNYSLALEYLGKAFLLSPESPGVRQFYASVLLSLGRDYEAWGHFREVFLGGSAVSSDLHFLQQYVLSQHRVGHKEELQDVWPSISATPGVGWRSPLQCPDHIDESLLDGAVPFPETSGLRVPTLLLQHRDAILAEFNAFQQRSDWQSTAYFKPNQDNDLVLGNRPQLWTELLLFDRGNWDHQACKLFATACRVMRGLIEIEGIAHGKRSGQVSLLSLAAGAKLVPHFGSVNWRYTAHLGLLVPEGVTMFAGEESRAFQQGEVLLLDDSFLHSVVHNGTGPRVTLFVNFFHPSVNPITHEQWLGNE